MDGRTDRILIARPRLHSMLRGKNRTIVSSFVWTQYRNVTDSDIHNPIAITAVCVGSSVDRCKSDIKPVGRDVHDVLVLDVTDTAVGPLVEWYSVDVL